MRYITHHVKTSLEVMLVLFGVLGSGAPLAVGTFHNATPIDIPKTGTSGAAGPYPSTIQVNETQYVITKVTVTLHDFFHTDPNDVVVILVGPQGDRVRLMMDTGDTTVASGLTITFDDDAASEIPGSSALASGNFRPESGGTPSNACDPLPAPFPAGTVGSALSMFQGKNPQGTWSLFVCDEITADTGSLAGGWSIHIQGDATIPPERPTAGRPLPDIKPAGVRPSARTSRFAP